LLFSSGYSRRKNGCNSPFLLKKPFTRKYPGITSSEM